MNNNYCDCNQGRKPCTCKMAPKLGEAVRRFGFVEHRPLDASPVRMFLNANELDARVKDMPNIPTREQVLKREVDALQELLTQRDMEIDYLATARPTVLRLDWYLILLTVVVHWAWWMWAR